MCKPIDFGKWLSWGICQVEWTFYIWSSREGKFCLASNLHLAGHLQMICTWGNCHSKLSCSLEQKQFWLLSKVWLLVPIGQWYGTNCSVLAYQHMVCRGVPTWTRAIIILFTCWIGMYRPYHTDSGEQNLLLRIPI